MRWLSLLFLLLPFTAEAEEAVKFYPNLRYAAPPVGKLRWSPPRPFTGPSAPGPVACPQLSGDGMGPLDIPQDEDCLLLNVWAPARGEGHPVIVFVHGGGLLSGAGLRGLYNGTRFAEQGFVFVTFNYRLGVLGFLSQEAAESGVSLGLLDQAAALKWVSDNISRFGGDPARLTLLGHSMGAYSLRRMVGLGLAPKGTRGVFLFSSGSMFGKKKDTLSRKERKALQNRPWAEVLARLEKRLLSLEPSDKENLAHWNGIALAQSYVQGEHTEPLRRAEAEALAGQVPSVVYQWRGMGTEHGDEIKALFGNSRQQGRVGKLVTSFAATSDARCGPGFLPDWIFRSNRGWLVWLRSAVLLRFC